MSQSVERALRPSLWVYGLILRLYPRSFRERFGDSMADTFARLLIDETGTKGTSGALDVWKTVLTELAPTVVSAHLNEGMNSPFPMPVRILLAAALPVAAYVAALRVSTTTTQGVVLTLWLILLGAGMLHARGRGWRCSFNAAVASAIGILLPALDDVFNGRMPPESFRAVPLLAAAAATIGL